MKRLGYFPLIILIFSSFLLSSTPETSVKNQLSSLFQAGIDARAKGNFDDALLAFSRTLKLIGDAKEKKDYETDILINLGVLYWNIGQTKDSLDYFVKAESSSKEQGQKSKTQFCRSVIDLTDLYFKAKSLRDDPTIKDYPESIKAFRQAIDIARKIGSGEHVVKCLRQLSLIYDETNNPREYYRLNFEAQAIARKLNIKRELEYSSYNIGRYYGNASVYSLALENFENSLKIATELNAASDQALSSMALSNTYSDLGQYDKALSYITPVLDIFRTQKDKQNTALTLLNLGVIYRRRGFLTSDRADWNRALSYYHEALGLLRSLKDSANEILILNNIGSVYSDLGNYSEAMRYFQEGLSKARKTNYVEKTGMILNNIGIVQATLGNYEESTQYYQQAIDLALAAHGGKILWEAYLERANAYKNQGKFAEAAEDYRRSITVIEDIRSKINMEELKASFLGTDKRIEPYQQLIDLFIKMSRTSPDKGYEGQAFNYLERAKARAFLDGLEVADIDISQRVDFKLLNRDKEIAGELSKLYTSLALPDLPEKKKREILNDIQALETEHESLKREIRLTSPAYADLHYPEIITLGETQKALLDSKTAIWAYSVGKDSSYVFVLTRKQLRVAALPPRDKIQAEITGYLKVITDKDNHDFKVGRELGRALMPFAMDRGISNIIIVPDDWLNFLPFEALPTGEGVRSWLIQKYRISYVPSISSYRELLRRQQARTGKTSLDLLAVGSPLPGPQGVSLPTLEPSPPSGQVSAGSGQEVSGLKFSGLEIQTIAALFKKDKTYVATGALATEKELKALPLDQFKILHFATHAYIDDKNPVRSYLLLSPDKGAEEDGFLQTREIFNLKVNADLVTLSACQTGLGQLIRGEGIEGLSRAFTYAGASGVLMSLWSIDDQASSQLMMRFYVHLKSSDSITEALQKTKVELIKSGTLSHPYYWGGFILSGKADTRIFPSAGPGILLPATVLAVLVLGAVIAIRRLRK